MSSKTFTVLVVEDEEFSRNLLCDFLKDIGELTGIFSAADANQAFRLIIMERPDLVFLDIEMPGKSGLELLKDLKKIGILPRIVFTTGYYKYLNQADQVPAYDFLLKPYDKPEIIAVCRRFMADHMQEKHGEWSDSL